MLQEAHREELRQLGIHMWHFEQHVGEAVFIPAGCPHQVRRAPGARVASCSILLYMHDRIHLFCFMYGRMHLYWFWLVQRFTVALPAAPAP